jgi:phosphoenolpyruvate synthase/pyruvate phosphate dikinase
MLKTPAEKYEKLIERLGGTNQDLGEMQKIANEILRIGFYSTADLLEYVLEEPKAAQKIREYDWDKQIDIGE